MSFRTFSGGLPRRFRVFQQSFLHRDNLPFAEVLSEQDIQVAFDAEGERVVRHSEFREGSLRGYAAEMRFIRCSTWQTDGGPLQRPRRQGRGSASRVPLRTVSGRVHRKRVLVDGTTPSDIDGGWKQIIDDYLEEFFRFFFPAVHAGIDFRQPYQYLDKELAKVMVDTSL